MVERCLAKANVAGPNPVSRSKAKSALIVPKGTLWHHSQAVRQRSAKSLSPVRFWVVPPNLPKWRNGRRKGFKIPRGRLRVGSSPTSGTKTTSKSCRFCFMKILKGTRTPREENLSVNGF